MMSRILFESPWLLIPVLIGVELALIVMWSWRQARWARSAALAWLLMAPVCVLAQSLIVTQREQIVQLCHDLAQAADDGDMKAIDARVAAGFAVDEFDREGFLQLVERALTRYDVDRAEVYGFDVTFPKHGRAWAELYGSCRVRGQEMVLDRLTTRWRIGVTLRGDAWLVDHVEVLPTPTSPIRNLADLAR